MTLALYMDEHIHSSISVGLRLREVDVLTVQADERSGISDIRLLDRATELQRVVFSQDQDFLIEAQRRQVEGIPFAGVIYAHQRIVTIGDCVRDLEVIAKASDLEDLLNRVQFLPL
jgi:predicted nuclease of predicted toxin-antitoxin system